MGFGMADVLLALDAGGTNLKYALMTPQGKPACPVSQVQMGRQVLFAFEQAAAHALSCALQAELKIVWAGVCCPGPFDFVAGQSLMRHKWKDAYQKPLSPVLRAVLGQVQIAFLHDSSAFMLGEGYQGAGFGKVCVGSVILGTGLGFAYMQGGRVQVTSGQRPRIALWNTPFRNGMAEDYVSRAAIRARFAKAGGDKTADVHDIAQQAFAGDDAAIRAFSQTGMFLGEIISPVMQKLGCAHLILGGQIARSAQLWMPFMGISTACSIACHLEDAALRGIAMYGAMGHDQVMEEGEE